MEQPWVLVAATVVSDMNDRLSPKNEPPTTAATMSGVAVPVRMAISEATGTKATIVPTDVPTHSDTTQAATKRPANRKPPGRNDMVSSTVAPTAPIAWADLAKAPANTKIHTMSRRSALPAPREKVATRSSSG